MNHQHENLKQIEQHNDLKKLNSQLMCFEILEFSFSLMNMRRNKSLKFKYERLLQEHLLKMTKATHPHLTPALLTLKNTLN